MEFLGLADDEFIRGKVPMTKEEIRILTLVKARIKPNAIVYDIGAGTGSLSIEAARLAASGQVYAIEKNVYGIELIKRNAEKFSLNNVTVIAAEAPDGLKDLPAPDTVLIGGSGSRLLEILDVITPKLKKACRLVLNCITIQTLATLLDYLRTHEDDYDYDAIQVQINRLHKVGKYDMANAINPIYIVTCIKK